ncbi:sensor domain-containing diguanylate cyclase [Alteromonas sediminis]|uniref:Sensor domain-containing diguanylate cyclase n=1 Tax=Alteromonas sediminis TaxID=2259342 RepID=A0A3N5Z8U2_9ALTE|nr:diguanylate cyclase [Alteromonas sediminis]RPJ67354.1 sensor domain-containing diguanylate cyclase [Alteromonas sediminis]
MNLSISRQTKLYIALFVGLYGLLLWIAVQTVTDLYVQKVTNQESAHLTQRSALLKSEIEALLFESIYLADSLANVVVMDPQLALENWAKLSEKLIGRTSIVRNLAIAPNDIIEKIYPISGNEQALGLNYSNVPLQYPSVLEAKQSGDVYLAGPVNLVQGGKGLVARFPIFTDYPKNKTYWGLVSVVIDYDTLLEDVGIDNINNMKVSLRRLDTASGERLAESFFGPVEVFKKPDFISPVILPGATWELATQFQFDSLESVLKTKATVQVIGTTIGIIVLLGLLLIARAFQIVRVASLHDELTGLPNRRFVLSHLKHILAKKRNGHQFSIFNIDINNFKSINDNYGHVVGDDVLCFVSEYLTESLRTSDMVSRVGGDEFWAIVDRTESTEEAHRLKDKLKNGVKARPFLMGAESIEVSMSIGVVVVESIDKSLDVLLKQADDEMYKDKQSMHLVND